MKHLFTAAFIAILCITNLCAQGTTQINIIGIHPILPSPFISDIENNYHSGMYQMIMTFTNQQPHPVEFEYHVSLFKNGSEIAHAVSKPIAYRPGTYNYRQFEDEPVIEFSSAYKDLFNDDLFQKVIRSGYVPEGSYTLEIELVPTDPLSGVISIPGFAHFEVLHPQPPFLLHPMDDASIAPVFSVFSWTPVTSFRDLVYEYELLIVEVLPGQTLQQAIESNREHLSYTTRQQFFIYTQEHLPLEVGKEYAWMVTAKEVGNKLPISDDGKTEIFSFTVSETLDFFDMDEP